MLLRHALHHGDALRKVHLQVKLHNLESVYQRHLVIAFLIGYTCVGDTQHFVCCVRAGDLGSEAFRPQARTTFIEVSQQSLLQVACSSRLLGFTYKRLRHSLKCSETRTLNPATESPGYAAASTALRHLRTLAPQGCTMWVGTVPGGAWTRAVCLARAQQVLGLQLSVTGGALLQTPNPAGSAHPPQLQAAKPNKLGGATPTSAVRAGRVLSALPACKFCKSLFRHL